MTNRYRPRSTSAIRRGFTILELMVTLAVAAILITMAIPSMRDLGLSSASTGQSNALLTNLNSARGEAVKSGTNVRVSANGSWNNGWTVAVDRNMNGVVDAADGDVVMVAPTEANPGFNWTAVTEPGGAPVTNLFYTATGELSTPTVGVLFKLKRPDTSDYPERCKRVLVAGSGRIEVQKGSAALCP